MSLDYAREVAQRSTCPSRPCGAVLVTAAGDLITGYTGAPRGQAHCDVIGCHGYVDHGYCTRAVPAELNAILEAARRGVSTVGSTLYVSRPPGPTASVIGFIINAGIKTVAYADDNALLASELQALLADAGIVVTREATLRP